MSAASAVSAAVRPPHPAVARRALLTLLFLGGFLALAFVFGGSAQAASLTGQDGREAPGAATSGLLKPGEPSGSSGGGASHKADRHLSKAELAERQRRAARKAAERAAAHVTDPVAEGGDRAREVTRPVGDAVEDVAGPGGLGELPGRLGLGELGDGIVGDGSDGGNGHGAGHGADCTPGATGHGAHGHADGPRTHGRSHVPYAEVPLGASGDVTADDGLHGGEGPDRGLPFHGTPAVPAPSAPSASQYTGDGQGQRGGPHEQTAVLGGGQAAGPLQPGAVRAADGTPTRDSAGDVLQLPG